MTVVAIHQPQYLPWIPYIDKINSCDIFVYLDNVQFQKNGVQNRNQIKTPQGASWLTVPVHANLTETIATTKICDRQWQKKHLKTLQQNYARARFAELLSQEFQPLLERPWEYLADLNIAVTEWLLKFFDVNCTRVRASQLEVTGSKDDLILNICQAVGATAYLSGQGAKSYQNKAKFSDLGIVLMYQDFQNQPYAQCYPKTGFVTDLSAIDLVLNLGYEAKTMVKK